RGAFGGCAGEAGVGPAGVQSGLALASGPRRQSLVSDRAPVPPDKARRLGRRGPFRRRLTPVLTGSPASSSLPVNVMPDPLAQTITERIDRPRSPDGMVLTNFSRWNNMSNVFNRSRGRGRSGLLAHRV